MKKSAVRRPMRAREQLLIVAALVICALGAYGLLRVKAKEGELKLFREELTRLQGEANAGKAPRQAGRELEEAREALAGAQGALEKTKKALADQTRDMVNASSSDAVESVMLEVTAAAARFGVDVQQAEPFTGQVPGMPGATGKDPGAVQPLAGRPMRKLVLAGRYADLSTLLEGLNSMRQTVRVLNFNLRVADGKAMGAASPRLHAEVVVLL